MAFVEPMDGRAQRPCGPSTMLSPKPVLVVRGSFREVAAISPGAPTLLLKRALSIPPWAPGSPATG